MCEGIRTTLRKYADRYVMPFGKRTSSRFGGFFGSRQGNCSHPLFTSFKRKSSYLRVFPGGPRRKLLCFGLWPGKVGLLVDPLFHLDCYRQLNRRGKKDR